jgi:hypothetical protein
MKGIDYSQGTDVEECVQLQISVRQLVTFIILQHLLISLAEVYQHLDKSSYFCIEKYYM